MSQFKFHFRLKNTFDRPCHQTHALNNVKFHFQGRVSLCFLKLVPLVGLVPHFISHFMLFFWHLMFSL